jgi:hypothetical protein
MNLNALFAALWQALRLDLMRALFIHPANIA